MNNYELIGAAIAIELALLILLYVYHSRKMLEEIECMHEGVHSVEDDITALVGMIAGTLMNASLTEVSEEEMNSLMKNRDEIDKWDSGENGN